MGWNPCCCWKLKDAAIVIGIWSAVYAAAQLGMFGWQWSVLAQCEHVTMAQSNLQCEYYCPCVGASTARTSALVQALFVIQVLCLIVSFFLLFAAVAFIYGVHTYSRCLVWPWFACMIASIFTSVAYCVTWWTGDVRDYWLVLTILEILAVFLNVYLLVVVMVFFKRMNRELDYYEGKRQHVRGSRKYDRFNAQGPDSPPTVEQDLDSGIDMGFRSQWDDPDRWYPDPQYPPPPPPDPYFDKGPMRPPYPTPTKGRYAEDDVDLEPPPPPISHAQSVPSLFDDSFRDVPRGHSRRSHRHRSCHCEHRSSRRHRRSRSRSRSRCRKSCDCSDVGSESTDSHHHHHHHHHNHRRHNFSDNESDESSHHPRHRQRADRRGPRQVKREDRDRERELRLVRDMSTQAELAGAAEAEEATSPVATGHPAQGFSIVIPPADAGLDADGNVQPREYRINSKITVSYDPKQPQMTESPRSGTRSSTRPQPVSYTSNV